MSAWHFLSHARQIGQDLSASFAVSRKVVFQKHLMWGAVCADTRFPSRPIVAYAMPLICNTLKFYFILIRHYFYYEQRAKKQHALYL